MTALPVVAVEKLAKSFRQDFWAPPVRAIDGVSFTITSGRITGFVGFNGSGKTTTLKCMLGFIRPDAGTVKLFGGLSPAEASRRIGYLPERPYYYDFLTGEAFLQYHWDLSRVPGEGVFRDRADELFRLVKLEDARARRLSTYSKGMLQRIGIAQALLRDPELLILDEPMSGLDPDGRELVRDVLAGLKGRGKTVFFSSHLLTDMLILCDDIVALHGGRVVHQGPLDELLRDEGPALRTELQSVRALEIKFQGLIGGRA